MTNELGLKNKWEQTIIEYDLLTTDDKDKFNLNKKLVSIFNDSELQDNVWKKLKLKWVFFDRYNEIYVKYKSSWRYTELWGYSKLKKDFIKKVKLTHEERKYIFDLNLQDIVKRNLKLNDTILADCINNKLVSNQDIIYILTEYLKINKNLSYITLYQSFREKNFEKSMQDLKEIIFSINDFAFTSHMVTQLRLGFGKRFKTPFLEYQKYFNDEECSRELRWFMCLMGDIKQKYGEIFPLKTYVNKIDYFIEFGNQLAEKEQSDILYSLLDHKNIHEKAYNRLQWHCGEYAYAGYGFVFLKPAAQDIYDSFKMVTKLK